IFNGILWLSGDSGVWKYTGNRGEKIYPENKNRSIPCHQLTAINGVIYFLSGEEGLMQINNGKILKILPLTEFPSRKISFMKEGGLGDIYFGTEDRGIQIFQIPGRLWLEIPEVNLEYTRVTDMTFDRWENAWVTSDGAGLTRFYSESFNIYPPTRLSGQTIRLLENWSDTVAIQYRNNTWDIILPGQFHPVPFSHIETRNRTRLNSGDFQGSFVGGAWIGSSSDSVEYQVDIPMIQAQEKIEALYRMDSANVIMTSDLALSSLRIVEGDSIPSIIRNDILALPIQTSIRDSSGIWLLGTDWLGLSRDGVVKAHTYLDHPLFIKPGPEGDILVGTRNGIYFVRFYAEELTLNKIVAKIPLINLRAAAYDKNGLLWITMQNTLLQCRVDPAKPMEILKVYDRASGLPRIEFLEGALVEGPGERIYAGTSSGLMELFPQQNFQSTTGPVLSVVRFRAGDQNFSPQNFMTGQELTKIRPKNSDVTITLKAVDLHAPRGIRYWYRMNAEESEWLESNSGGNFQFYSLPAGNYFFEAKATNFNSQSSNILRIPIKVLLPFYLRWWFICAAIFSLAGLTYLFYRRRLRLRLLENEQKNEALKTQNKILHLEQSATRLQMNPHFIFNALQSIQSSIAGGDRTRARADLQIFSKLMRSYLEHARVEKIALEEEIKLLDQYLRVERELKDQRVSYEITVAPAIDPSFVEIPTMLLQPFVENAIKHGQPADGEKGKIVITFDWFGKYLSCSISDNGMGINKSEKNTTHRSAGMDITRQRLETYFRNQKIEPLRIETGSGGTTIKILLPTEP
ncbi:MAG: histidine kinase, partial [Saprospiraceae bacterium]|nr:histidine kinase [Saprospiraceae bacterium]